MENLFTVCVVTVFMGQVYINPFYQWFRFSLAVVALSLLLIYFKDIKIVFSTTIIGMLIVLFRAFVHFITYHEMTFFETVLNYLPAAIFYFVFGLFFYVLDIRNKLNNPVTFILYLWICDSLGNIAEGIIRSNKIHFLFDEAILTIIIIGFVRTMITYIAYSISVYYKNKYDREQNESKYKELLLFIAKLKTELFFLRKSVNDIEDTMKKSYMLYEKLQGSELEEQALDISRNIHEIKKDYLRVVTGMEKTLSEENQSIYMSLKEIFHIINDNTKKILNVYNKDITLEFIIKHNFYTYDYYSLISILNNLIINSIESIEYSGEIVVKEELNEDNYIFKVIDNGIGFGEDDIDIIFEPGYSTKYDSVTGKMSTGIGLCHAKHIIKNHYEGNITAENAGNNTIFEITIPAKNIKIRK